MRRRRPQPQPPTRPLLLALLALLLAAAAALGLRRARGAGGAETPVAAAAPGGDPADAPAVEALATEGVACPECGHELRRQGEDRHVVYWEPGASSSDPLLEPTCPACGAHLPREHPERAG